MNCQKRINVWKVLLVSATLILQMPFWIFLNGNSLTYWENEHNQEFDNSSNSSHEDNLQIFSFRARNIYSHCRNTQNLTGKNQKTDAAMVDDIKRFAELKVERRIAIMPEKRLIWCMVPKVASSSFINAVAVENNWKSSESVNTFFHWKFMSVYFKGKVELNDTSEQFVSFHITRHPFDRIVSAYRDKLENSSVHDGFRFQEKYGRKIVNIYRDYSVENQTSQMRKEPTFYEYVRYLLNTDRTEFDLHWKPISMLCDVCLFPYDFVLKLENFEKEYATLVNFLIRNNHVSSKFQIKWDNKKSDKSHTREITKKYIKKLPKIYVWNLYEVYKDDFDYYDYEISEFL